MEVVIVKTVAGFLLPNHRDQPTGASGAPCGRHDDRSVANSDQPSPTVLCKTPGQSPEDLAERVRGIEPPFSAWEADVLPLNYTREGARS